MAAAAAVSGLGGGRVAAGPAACGLQPAQGMVRELARISHRGEPGRLFKAGGWWRSGFAASQTPARA